MQNQLCFGIDSGSARLLGIRARAPFFVKVRHVASVDEIVLST